MSELRTRMTALQERIVDGLSGMTPRDRALLLSLVAFVLLLTLGGGGWWMNRSLSGAERRLSDMEGRLSQAQLLQAQQESAAEEAAQIRESLKANGDTDLSAYLEQAAAKVAISEKLAQVRPKSTSDDGVVEQRVYDVSLKDLSLDELTSFLYQIETSKYPMRIQTFKVKRRQKGSDKVLTVDMDIAAYRVSEGVDGGEG